MVRVYTHTHGRQCNGGRERRRRGASKDRFAPTPSSSSPPESLASLSLSLSFLPSLTQRVNLSRYRVAAQGSAGFDNLDISRVAERFCPPGGKREIRPRGNKLWRIPHLQREPKPSQMKKPRHLLLSHLPDHLRNTAAGKKSTLRIYRKYARTSCCTLVVQSSCALPSGESGISVPTKVGGSHFWTCLSRLTGLALCRPP